MTNRPEAGPTVTAQSADVTDLERPVTPRHTPDDY
jgi:hypothetical protein